MVKSERKEERSFPGFAGRDLLAVYISASQSHGAPEQGCRRPGAETAASRWDGAADGLGAGLPAGREDTHHC